MEDGSADAKFWPVQVVRARLSFYRDGQEDRTRGKLLRGDFALDVIWRTGGADHRDAGNEIWFA
jgi:hypothetical protein